MLKKELDFSRYYLAEGADESNLSDCEVGDDELAKFIVPLKKGPDLSDPRYFYAEGAVLNLSDCEIGEGEFEAFVVPFLKTHPEIKILDLSNMTIRGIFCSSRMTMARHELNALVTALPPDLTELYLNVAVAVIGTDWKNGPIVALSTALPKTITVFDLRINDIGTAGVQALAKALSPNLTKLNLCRRRYATQPVGIEAIKVLAGVLDKALNLTELTLTRFCIEAQGAKALGDALANKSKLAKLNLSLNNIGVDGTKAIAQSIIDKHNLTTLNLGANGMRSICAEFIAPALVDKPNLTELDLSWNWLGVNGAKSLAGALGKLNLTSLDFSSNSLKDEGVKVLCDSLVDQSNLEHLHLGLNEMTDVGAKEICKIFFDQNVSDEGIKTICDTPKPKKKPNFSELNVACNKIGDTGAVAFSKVIGNKQNFSKLNLRENLIGDQGAAAICDALVGKEKIEKFNCTGNPISDRSTEMLASVLAAHPSFSWKQNGGMRCLRFFSEQRSFNERICDEALKDRCERMFKEADPVKRANFARQQPVEKKAIPDSTEQSSEISTTQSGSAGATVAEKKGFPTPLPSLESMTIFAIQKVLQKAQNASLSPEEKNLRAQLLPTQEALHGLPWLEQQRMREAKLREVLPESLVEKCRPKM